MAKIADKYCHKIYITDDNPRNENQQKLEMNLPKYFKNKAFNIGIEL